MPKVFALDMKCCDSIVAELSRVEGVAIGYTLLRTKAGKVAYFASGDDKTSCRLELCADCLHVSDVELRQEQGSLSGLLCFLASLLEGTDTHLAYVYESRDSRAS